MRTLETGKTRHNESGFTLIEMLLVVVIIGITAYMGVNLINSQSAERNIMSAAARFQAGIEYVCDQAILENRAYGIEFTHDGQFVMQHQHNQWAWLEGQQLLTDLAQFPHAIYINGRPISLKPDVEQQPHLICQSDGSLSPFELRVWIPAENPSENQTGNSYYKLKNDSPWIITGAWHEA
ncbi:type II secretion system minor pseudopilin GspH [Marinicella sediminis]|uniref:Type II secretion system protein H n=1 Tax=Marinicella sediminis TaxID=1792834 RepID=A0ABV7JB77_9GAMM|nr:type II secretion system minor pseudopilin GspH [Marinicella sediminis]